MTPVVGLIVATKGLLVVQTPFAVVSEYVILALTQTVSFELIIFDTTGY